MLSNRIAPASPTVAAPSAEMQELKELLKEQFGSINSSLARMEQRIDALEGVSGAAKASVTNEVQAVRAMGLVEMDRKKSLISEMPLRVDPPGVEKRYDVFISHSKKIVGSEQKALMISDCFEEVGMTPFIDLQNLEEISEEQLIADVRASRCLVTVVDTETFNSPWVLLENTTAVEAGIPIVPFYDGEAFQWNDISFWVAKHPSFFKIPAVQYNKGYHKQAKALLIAKARGEHLSGLNSALEAMTDVVGRSAKVVADAMRGKLDAGTLPPATSKLARATTFLADEVRSLPPSATEDQSVDGALGDLRGCLEELDDTLQRVPDALAKRRGGGLGCGGGAAPPSTSKEVIDGLMAKDVEVARLRAALKRALRDARRMARIKNLTSASGISDFWKLASGGEAKWEDFVATMASDLKAAGAEDTEVAAAAEKAAALLPALKSKLVDPATGKLRGDLVTKVLGAGGGDARNVLLDAAESASQVERVFYPGAHASSAPPPPPHRLRPTASAPPPRTVAGLRPVMRPEPCAPNHAPRTMRFVAALPSQA
jgi:hypothetical protein